MPIKPVGDPALRLLRYAHTLFRGVFILFITLLLVNTYFATIFRVDGHSMDPTLHDGQFLGICKMCYWGREPQKGDVVIVQYEGSESVHFVKRITGLPGGIAETRNGKIRLEYDQYFVEGDNKEHSTDSRIYGPILREQILGKVLGVKQL
jgi:signal peptidase I